MAQQPTLSDQTTSECPLDFPEPVWALWQKGHDILRHLDDLPGLTEFENKKSGY